MAGGRKQKPGKHGAVYGAMFGAGHEQDNDSSPVIMAGGLPCAN